MVKNALGRLEGRAEAQKIAQGLVNRVNCLLGLRSADLTIYVTQGLLEKLKPGRSKCPFYADGYGRFWPVFVEPWVGTEE